MCRITITYTDFITKYNNWQQQQKTKKKEKYVRLKYCPKHFHVMSATARLVPSTKFWSSTCQQQHCSNT